MTNLAAKKESAEFSEDQISLSLALVPINPPGESKESDEGKMITQVKADIEESRKNGIGDPEVASEIADILNSDGSLETLNITDLENVVNKGIVEYNKIDKTGKGLVAVSGISLGRVLILIKRKVVARGDNWTKYANSHFQGMSQRTREKYMRVATCKDAAEFYHLGIENLYNLAMAVKGMSSDTPITDFVEKYSIDTNTESEVDPEDFEILVKTAALQQRAVSAGVTLKRELASGFVCNKVTINTADFNLAKEIKDAGGQEAKFFEKKAISSGSNTKKPAENSKTTSRIKSFSKVATAMAQVISEALSTSSEDVLKDIDASKVEQLIINLNALQQHLRKQ
jgi:hypothetical protein